MNIDYKLIGGKIKEERKKRSMTQEVLAERLDVSIGYISQVERGITKISLDLLGAISATLGCDVATLITGSAIGTGNYLTDELMSEIGYLNGEKRKLLLEFARLLSRC